MRTKESYQLIEETTKTLEEMLSPLKFNPDGTLNIRHQLDLLPQVMDYIRDRVFALMDLYRNWPQPNLQPARSFFIFVMNTRVEEPDAKGLVLEQDNLLYFGQYIARLSNFLHMVMSWLRDLLDMPPVVTSESENEEEKEEKKSIPEILADLEVNGYLSGGTWALLTKEGKYRKLSQMGYGHHRTIKGHLLTLDPDSMEDRNNYKSWMFQEKVEKDGKKFLNQWRKR